MLDFTNLPPIARGALLLLVFLTVIAIVMATSAIVTARVAVRRRLQESITPSTTGTGASLRSVQTNNAWVKFVNYIEKRGLSLEDTKGDKLRTRMIAAGFTHPAAPRMFTLIRLGLTVALPVAYLIFAYTWGKPPTVIKLYFFCAGLALLGLYLPNVFISARIDRRRTAVINAFPDALDLMLVCVEAGLGLEAAFSRVGSEIVRSHPLLAEMLGMVVLEMRAGRSREDALRLMADRAQIDEIRSFTTLLIQSTKLGSSIGQTLRVYASEMREQRRLRAEEKAHRLPVLLSLPLVACMLPAMIGVLMVPAVIRVIRQVMPALGH